MPWSESSCSSGSVWSSRRQRLDAERQRRHVEQQHVGTVASQHAALNGGAYATASSGFTSLRGSLPKKFFTASITFGMRV